MDIARGHYDYWSYPSYPSHIDHIFITEPLKEIFYSPSSIIEIVPLDLLFSSWDDYDFMVSDHRPLKLILSY